MATIEVPLEIVDRALVVVVDGPRRILAVWKGRGRVDLHDLSGTWHETLHPYPRHEEGTWSRDDVRRYAETALADAAPPEPSLPAFGPAVQIDVDALSAAHLVRATELGYALWKGREAIDLYRADGRYLQTLRVPPGDLATMSRLMHDLLEVFPQLSGGGSRQNVARLSPSG